MGGLSQEFRTEAIPEERWARGGWGRWSEVRRQAREASHQGRAIVLDNTVYSVRQVRRSMYSQRLAGEHPHIFEREDGIYVWFTFDDEPATKGAHP